MLQVDPLGFASRWNCGGHGLAGIVDPAHWGGHANRALGDKVSLGRAY